jgi:hypothetical protein
MPTRTPRTHSTLPSRCEFYPAHSHCQERAAEHSTAAEVTKLRVMAPSSIAPIVTSVSAGNGAIGILQGEWHCTFGFCAVRPRDAARTTRGSSHCNPRRSPRKDSGTSAACLGRAARHALRTPPKTAARAQESFDISALPQDALDEINRIQTRQRLKAAVSTGVPG